MEDVERSIKMDKRISGKEEKSGGGSERSKEVSVLKGFTLGEGTGSSVQIADYQKIQYEELLKEMQRDTQTLGKAINQTYVEVRASKSRRRCSVTATHTRVARNETSWNDYLPSWSSTWCDDGSPTSSSKPKNSLTDSRPRVKTMAPQANGWRTRPSGR